MTLVYACIAPHGGELVPELGGEGHAGSSRTRKGMLMLASQVKAANPSTIVVATPHNLRLQKHIGVVLSENSRGKVVEGDKEITLAVKCDLGFGRRLVASAERRGLPVVGANYGALEGPMSDLAMDWGTLVPLWFFLRRNRLRSKVVIVTPSRGIPLKENFDFGRVIGELAESEKKSIAFVASSDQAHTHDRSGPYGYSAAAAVYDEMVVEAIKAGRLESIMSFDKALVDAAKPDSLWQMTMLAGLLSRVRMNGEVLSYQVPTYYGMLCAAYTVAGR